MPSKIYKILIIQEVAGNMYIKANSEDEAREVACSLLFSRRGIIKDDFTLTENGIITDIQTAEASAEAEKCAAENAEIAESL